jgi:hypothetical protein
VRIRFDFKVSVTQWTRAVASTSCFVVLRKKAKTDQAPHTFAVGAGVCNRFFARRANSNLLLVWVNNLHDVKI